jgi:ABC-type hemin transport system ATPase subunit
VVLAGGRVVAAGEPAEIASAELIAEHYGARVRVVGEGDSLAVIPIRRQ